jgi:hypothetical protein
VRVEVGGTRVCVTLCVEIVCVLGDTGKLVEMGCGTVLDYQCN